MNVIDVNFTQTGREFEVTIFGETISLTREQARQIPQLSFGDGLAQAEANAVGKFHAGLWNPSSPPTISAFELQQAVQHALHLSPRRLVEFISTLGTPLDVHWGVDGYFGLLGIPRKWVIVTVDLTTNFVKAQGDIKADLPLTPADLSSSHCLKKFANKVASLLQRRYEGWEHQQR